MSPQSMRNRSIQMEEEAAAAGSANTAPFPRPWLRASRKAVARKSATCVRPCMIVFGSFWGLTVGQDEKKGMLVQRPQRQSTHREHQLAMVRLGMLDKEQMAI